MERARLCRRLGQIERAEGAYARAFDLQPSNLVLLQEYKGLLVDQRKWSEAISLFDKALALQPKNDSFLTERARLYAKLGQWEHVAKDFIAILHEDRFDTAPFERRAVFVQELLAWPKAFDKALLLRPDEASLWIGRARYHVARSDWSHALADYAHAIPSLVPDPNDNCWLEYGALLLLTDDQPGYDRLCAAGVGHRQKGTKNPYLDHVLARLCSCSAQKVSEPSLLVQWAAAAAKARNPAPWDLHALGAAHLRAGYPKEAMEWFELSRKSLPSWPGQPMNGIFLALADQRLGHADETRRWLEETDAWLAVARRRIKENNRNPAGWMGVFPAEIYPADWLIVLVLRREAEQLQFGKLKDAGM
jgi:tetratricopeptide (TPR) repeat protein